MVYVGATARPLERALFAGQGGGGLGTGLGKHFLFFGRGGRPPDAKVAVCGGGVDDHGWPKFVGVVARNAADPSLWRKNPRVQATPPQAPRYRRSSGGLPLWPNTMRHALPAEASSTV